MRAKLLVAGKRSGRALVVGRQDLLQALQASSALAVAFDGVWVGRAGFVKYLTFARQGASVIKLVPEDGQLKVDFGALGFGRVRSGRWVPENRRIEAQGNALQVLVSPRGRYVPNVGAGDLADAFARALATTLPEVIAKVALTASEDGLVIRSADSAVFFETVIPAVGVEGKAVVWRDEAAEIARALKKARRARIELRHIERERTGFDGSTIKTESAQACVLAGPYEFLTTELVPGGDLLDENKVQGVKNVDAEASAFFGPREFTELLRGVALMAGGEGKQRTVAPITVSIKPGKVVLTSDGEQDATVAMEAHGKGKAEFRCNATVLLRALKAFGGTEPVEMTIGSQTQPLVLQTEATTVSMMGYKPAAQPAQPPPSEEEEEEEEVAAQVAEDLEAIEEAEAEVEAEEAELAEAAEELEEVEEPELAPVS